MEIKIDNKIFFGIDAAAAVGFILFASCIGGGLFGRASSAEIEQGKNNCVRWIPREFDYVRYNTHGEFEHKSVKRFVTCVAQGH